MKWGKALKGLLSGERRAAALLALAGVKVHGVPVGDLQAEGEQIGAEANAVVKQFKKPAPPSTTGE
jgi:hypothetical protein